MLRKITDNIFSVGAVDFNRRLFDELIPLPDGTSYNSYLVKGIDKTALIDTVDPAEEEQLFDSLKRLNVDSIDYIIANHAEQDHSGSIPKLLEMFSMAKVVTNAKCKPMLMDLLLIPEDKFIVIGDGEELLLGGRTLQFVLTPWVHWPETMVTYLKEDKILFSCDFFGAHYASTELFVSDEAEVYPKAKRYFAEIMMPFKNMVKSNIEKVLKLDVAMIAPSHGQVYNNPKFIIDAYIDWTSDNFKNQVIVPYTSMHGSTKAMVDYFMSALVDRGILCKPFDMSKTDIGEIAISLVDTPTVVFGTSTVLAGPHPLVASAAFLANALRPNIKFASIIGSYGWGGKTVEILAGMLSNIKAEILEPVIVKGHPKGDDKILLDNLADEILKRHRELKLC